MANSKKLLRDVLAILVVHWGREQVHKELERIRDDDRSDGPVEANSASRRKSRRKAKPLDILARYQLPDRIKEEATQLTAMYEAKTFLPTIADVKYFLEARGRQIRGVKNRDQAFVKVIDLVLKLPPESIHQLRNSAVHGVPSRLGPISDAIGSAGETLRGRRTTGS